MSQGQYPVPVRHRYVNMDSIGHLLQRNDPAAWGSVTDWMSAPAKWTPYGPNPPADSPGHGLVLLGPVGTGKTTIASVCLTTIERTTKFTTAFVTDFELAALLRRARDDEALAQVLFLQQVGFLVVDDLMRMGTHQMPLEVEGFLRVRENNGWPTIVTINTNVTLPDTLNSVMTTWSWAIFGGKDMRDPDIIEQLKNR